MSERVLVTGGRDFGDAARVALYLDSIHGSRGITVLIHGGASGADTLAGAWAMNRGIPVEVYPADWKTHGRAAGPIRNARMLLDATPTLVVAFPGGRGTADMVSKARAAGVDVIEDGAWRKELAR